MIPEHQKRLNSSALATWNKYPAWDLETILMIPAQFRTGRVKARVVAFPDTYLLGFYHYQAKEIAKLQIVEAPHLQYAHKFADRTDLEALTEGLGVHEEIIIFQNNLATDASYANLLFEKEGTLYTPKTPLLAGIKRGQLLKDKQVVLADISIQDVFDYEKIHLINAMLDPGEVTIHVSAETILR